MNEMVVPGDPVVSWRRLRRIQAVTTELSRADSREAAAKIALDAAIEIMEADAGLVAIATGDGAHIRFLYSVGYPPEEDEALDDVLIPIERPTPTVQAVATGQPFFAPDGAAVVAHYPTFAEKVRRTGFEAAAYIPMRGVHQVLGAFHVVYRTPRRFTDEEVSLLTAIADQCAVAMEREIHFALVQEREEQLERTTRLLRSIAATTTDLIYVKDREGVLIFANEPTARAFGKPIAEVIGSDERMLLPPEEAKVIRANDDEVMRSGSVQVFEESISTPEGPVVYLSTKDPLRDERGEVIGLVCVSRDITDRKEMERELVSERDRSAAMLEALQDGFFVMDAAGTLRSVTDRFCEIVGFRRAALVDRSPPYPFFPRAGPDLDRATASIARALARPTAEFDLRLVRGDGRPLHALVTTSALRDAAGGFAEFVGTIKDVTRRRRSQAHVEQLQGLAEKLAVARTSDEVARALLEQLDRLVATDMAAVAVVDDDKTATVLHLTGLTEQDAAWWRTFSLEPGRPVSDTILQNRIVALDSSDAIVESYPAVAKRYEELGFAATAIFPLSVPSGTLGALILSFRAPRSLDAEEVATTSALARQAAQSLERARTDAAEAAARERVQRLQDVSNALGAAVEVGQVCEVAGAAVSAATHADAVAVLLRPPGARRPRIRYTSGFSDRELKNLRAHPPSDDPLWLESAEDVATHLGIRSADSRYGALVMLPLTQGTEASGVLIIGFHDERRILLAQRDLLLAIAGQTSQALDRAGLYAAQAISAREAERYAMRAAQLQTFTAALSGVSTTEDVLSTVIEHSVRIAEASGAWVFLAEVDDERSILRLAAGSASPDGLVDGPDVHSEADDGVAECFRERTESWFSSLDIYARRYPTVDPARVSCRGGIAILPLGVGETPLGVFVLQFAKPRRFKGPDRAFLHTIAELAGNAVERARLFDAREVARNQAEYERTRIERLQRATAHLARAASAEEAADELLAVASEVTRASGGRVLLAEEDGTFRQLATIGDAPQTEEGASPLDHSPPARRAYESGVAGWTSLEALGPGAGIFVVPLLAAGPRVGVLELRFLDGSAPSNEDRELVVTLASQAAVVLRRARTYEVEHEVASTLQRAMLPELPEPMGFRVQGRYRAATDHLDVGGDWFDAVELGVDRLALVVGDVVGRGLPAATAMGQLRTAWRALVVHGADPGEAMEGLDAFASATIGAECTTVAGAVIDGAEGVVRYACAGHLPPLVVSRDGRTRYLTEGRRPPLGVTEAGPLVEGVERFETGETLVLYTDGLVERRNETLDDGLARLSSVASGLAEQAADRMSDELIDRLTRGSALADDVALLVVRALPLIRRSAPARPEQLADMRSQMRSWLGSQGVADAVIQDVVLAAGEAAANAAEHAYFGSPNGGPLEWGVSLEPGRGIVVSVRDRGMWRGTGADPDRGNGLQLIRALMDEVDIDSGAAGTTVTMSRRLEDSHAVV